MVNFDKLFPHSFVVLTPKKCEGVFLEREKLRKEWGKRQKPERGVFAGQN